MNREIKFRYVYINLDTKQYRTEIWTLEQIEKGEIRNSDYCMSPMYKLIARQQFTGLKDKNGKEIYEGGIVRVRENPDESDTTGKSYQVSWMGPEYPAFDLEEWDGESNALAEIEQSGGWEIEVIGNIYESLNY